MPVSDTPSPRLAFAVVGIGASAGGLEAFIEFFDAMPPNRGLAFVLVQHLSPKHESMVAELLQKHTAMPVLQVEDGMAVEPDHVYVIRPGHTMTLRDGRLRLGESLLKPGHSRPVDDFFRSLAEEQHERAIGMILSGMGSNGTAGAQAIKVVGGLGIAQEPSSAKFPAMPRSMVEANLADFILKPAEMPDVLLRYAGHAYARDEPRAELIARSESHQVGDILAILRARVRNDFSGYKRPTVVRRIQRRMSLTQHTSMADYARLLRQTPTEVQNLSDDLMIHVTGFFRDPEVWEALRDRVIGPMVAEKPDQASIRVWVTACASGEEAYTLAMLLVEAAEQADKQFDIKVFATDMAERELVHARAGIYPGGIESEIAAARLTRFFDKDESVYRVKKHVRELVVFAPQNVLQDPPFSRLDIVTCRNLLIYLEPEVQRRVLSLLHFGLREGGVMVLGSSETVGAHDGGLFEPIDKKLRIYRRVGPTRHGAIDFPSRPGGRRGFGLPADPDRPPSRATLSQATTKTLLDRFTPPSVVVDRLGRIVYFHGETGRFLRQPSGEPTRDVLELATDAVRGPVRVALTRAIETAQPAASRDGVVYVGDKPHQVEVHALPIEQGAAQGNFLISFVHYPVSQIAVKPDADAAGSATQDELRALRDELQTTIEKLQTSNEEMKASHEEATSINEELQSTNEELETSKEELQSLNEELTTVNAQLHAKMEELGRTGNDLNSLLSSTDIAVIFLDTQFRIRRYTPAIQRLMVLIPGDVGRPLADLARRFDDPRLLDDAKAVLGTLQPVEAEVTGDDGRGYTRRVLPYRTADDRIDGTVITFVDVTDRRDAERKVRDSDDRLRTLLTAGTEALYRMSADWGTMLMLAGNNFLADTPESNQTWLDHYIPAEDRPEVTAAIGRAVATRATFDFEHRVRRADGSVGWASSRAVPVLDSAGRVVEWFGIATAITDRKTAEAERARLLDAEQHARTVAEAANAGKDQFLANLGHELRTPLSAMLIWSKVLQEPADARTLAEGVAAIEQSARAQQKLIDDLLDSARIATGKLSLDLRPVDLGQVIRRAADTLRPATAAKGVGLHVDIGKAVGVVMADADRLQQVVWNLINNAVKFTPAGGRVDVSVWRPDGSVAIRVADTGQGIDADLLPLVFGRFEQGDPSRTRRHGGLGLGLSISRQIVELHGGTIEAKSDGPGRGSVFTIVLPLPRTRPTARPPSAPEELAGVRVALVEDDAQLRDVVTMLLQRAGATVDSFAAADAAQAAVLADPPDVLLSDIGLPDKDGYALIREIRAREAPGVRLPAVAFTAFDRPQDRAHAIESGFDEHVAKPFDPARLIQTVRTLLRTRQEP